MKDSHTVELRPAHEVEHLLRRWLPVLACVVSAVYVGYLVGTNNWRGLWQLVGAAAVTVVAFSLQDKGWVLVPMFWWATGSISVLPIPFSWRDFAIFLAVAAYVAHRSVVRVRAVPMRHELVAILLLNLAWIVAMWIRKPVGFRVLGSEYMGARFYYNMFMAAVAAWVVVRLPQSQRHLFRVPYYLFGGTWIPAIAGVVAYLAPSLGGLVLSLYREAPILLDEAVGIRRFAAFRDTATLGALLMVSHVSALKLFDPFKPYLYLLAACLAGIGISGFRISVAIFFAYIWFSMILRRNWRQFWLASIVCVVLVAVLLLGQGRLYSLPLPVQRSLSFLPGKWSETAVQDATGTAVGRLQWWRDIVKYGLIKNWLFGDGIGVRVAEEAAAVDAARRRYEEAIFFYGAFHNGPLTTIRCVGIVGLVLLYTLFIANVKYALRCVRQCLGTQAEPVAFFVAIPILWVPIQFTFLFGAFETDMPSVIFQTGLLLLLIRMLREHPELLKPKPVVV
ncbi:MAG: O-antigen ligase family protein [Verrucomicrobiae bacterium]|nr:O-antigen ligase family protein [Verrucomicrobiae bacterium]